MKRESGNMLAAFVGCLLLAAILLPLVIWLLQTETNQSVNQRKSTMAYQLAEAAVAKGVAKLTETRKNWTDAVGGVPIAWFRGLDNEAFTDIPGGSYKVVFSSGSVPGAVRITGKGRDSTTKAVRVIVAEYSGSDPDGPAMIFNGGGPGTVILNPWVEAHWGSIKSYGDCYYFMQFPQPRLYSAGSTLRDNNPAQPNTNNVDNWSFKGDMGSPPLPDLAYYRQKAMNSVVPSSSTKGEIRLEDGTPVVRNPVGSGYFRSDLQSGRDIFFDKLTTLPQGMGNYYEFRCSTCVIFSDGNLMNSSYVHFRDMFLDVEAVIVNWDGWDLIGSVTPYMVFGATIPETAPIQYQGTTRWVPGPTGQEVWVNKGFSAVYAQPDRCCYNLTNVQIHGYFYSPTFAVGGGRMVGVLHAGQPGGGSFSGGFEVYYDPRVLGNVVWQQNKLHLLSWKESSAVW